MYTFRRNPPHTRSCNCRVFVSYLNNNNNGLTGGRARARASYLPTVKSVESSASAVRRRRLIGTVVFVFLVQIIKTESLQLIIIIYDRRSAAACPFRHPRVRETRPRRIFHGSRADVSAHTQYNDSNTAAIAVRPVIMHHYCRCCCCCTRVKLRFFWPRNFRRENRLFGTVSTGRPGLSRTPILSVFISRHSGDVPTAVSFPGLRTFSVFFAQAPDKETGRDRRTVDAVFTRKEYSCIMSQKS